MQQILRRLRSIRTPKETSPCRGFALWTLVVAVLVLRAGTPLTLDESLTFWIFTGNFTDLIDRTLRYQGQSPLYFAIAWAALHVPLPIEVALRLPSLAALLATSMVLGRISGRFFGAWAGGVTTLATVFSLELLFGADARPYALAILAASLASAELLAWLDARTDSHARKFIVYSTFTFYLHYLFGGMLIVHAVWLVSRRALREFLRYWRFIAFAAIIHLPGAMQLITMSGKASRFSFAPEPELIDAVRAWFTPALFFPVGLGILAVYFAERKLPRYPSRAGYALVWHAIPPLAIFLLSLATSAHLMVDRYYAWHVPAITILIGAPLAGYAERASRIYTCVALSCALLIGASSWASRPAEEWRDAANTIKHLLAEGRPARVFAVTGLVEGLAPEYFESEESREYLVAPFLAYPPGAPVSPVPVFTSNERHREYVSAQLKASFANSEDIVLALRIFQQPLCDHLREVFVRLAESEGFETKATEEVGGITLILLSASPVSPKTTSNPTLSPEGASTPENREGGSKPL